MSTSKGRTATYDEARQWLKEGDKPRRMKANPKMMGVKGVHCVEHNWNQVCDMEPKCLPVDAPVETHDGVTTDGHGKLLGGQGSEPRRMKANLKLGVTCDHYEWHDENPNCKDYGCLPVNAPVEPRQAAIDRLMAAYPKEQDADERDNILRTLVELIENRSLEMPTPPPAAAPVPPCNKVCGDAFCHLPQGHDGECKPTPAPGTPVERWPRLTEAERIALRTALARLGPTGAHELEELVERLCALLDEQKVIVTVARQQLREKVNTLDLMRDEFQRIAAVPRCPEEIKGLCERAVTVIHQKVPVIVQRDNAERDAQEQRTRAEKLEERLDGYLAKHGAPPLTVKTHGYMLMEKERDQLKADLAAAQEARDNNQNEVIRLLSCLEDERERGRKLRELRDFVASFFSLYDDEKEGGNNLIYVIYQMRAALAATKEGPTTQQEQPI